MKLTDAEWAAAKKLRNHFGEKLERAAECPEDFGTAFIMGLPAVIESLERLIEAGHRPS
jgi:hypothetical protein